MNEKTIITGNEMEFNETMMVAKEVQCDNIFNSNWTTQIFNR